MPGQARDALHRLGAAEAPILGKTGTKWGSSAPVGGESALARNLQNLFQHFCTWSLLMKKILAATASCMLIAGAAHAQTAAPAPTPEWTVAGNASLNSDYRFRGFTQTNYGAALQGGIDIAHSSGFYVGNWNSNVGQDLYNGASLEMDFYGGFKGEVAPGLGYDVGAIYYYYPQSGVDRTGSLANKKISNQEVYLGLSYGALSAKLFYATGDYFKTAELAGSNKISTKGTTYLDVSYTQDIDGLILGAHYGLLTLKHYDQFTMSTDVGGGALSKSVGDYKLSIGKDVGAGYVLTGAYVGTTKKGYFATDLGAATAAGKSSVVVSVAKTF
jgi:uncharacterized protein (TIGR02001 family)